jgi:hypothetical protein
MFGAFLTQQFAVPLLAFLACLVVPNPFEPAENLKSRIGAVLVYVAVSALAGAIGGIAARRVFGVRNSGLLIWVIPSVLVVLALVYDSFTFTFLQALSNVFLPPPDGEGWWIFMLLTAPALACIGYSLVMLRPLKQNVSPAADPRVARTATTDRDGRKW